VLEGLLTIFLTFIASYGLAFGLKFALNTEYPLGAIPTGSMIPTYNIGDLILIRGPNSVSEIRVGDVIVFHNPKPGCYDELIIHRVNSTYSRNGIQYFVTKGDNNPSIDYWPVPASYVVGKVVAGVPFLGYVFLFINGIFDKMGVPLDLRTPLLTIGLAILVILSGVFPSEKEKVCNSK